MAEPEHPDQQLLCLARRKLVVGATRREQVLAGFLGCLQLGAADAELLQAGWSRQPTRTGGMAANEATGKLVVLPHSQTS